jgi:RND family efflux transporter MFP subunit
MRRFLIILLVVAGVAVGVYFATAPISGQIVLTGIVTTDEVIVSSQVQGKLQQLLVNQGDNVKSGRLLGVIDAQEENADVTYYSNIVQQYAALIKQASAQLENARMTFNRDDPLFKQNAISEQDYTQARTSYDAALAFVESLKNQKAGVEAQLEKAKVQLGYTQIIAPLDGIVDTRAALQGEVVNPAQPIVTLIDQDDLWIRADVEETYIDRIRIGDQMKITLPSGDVRTGTVYYRAVDADYATQRDVSRTKRDIRTFEVRLHCDNTDRRLAVGMTAYVTLPLGKP